MFEGLLVAAAVEINALLHIIVGTYLESRGIGAGSSPIGCEGFLEASKVQGSRLLLSSANNSHQFT